MRIISFILLLISLSNCLIKKDSSKNDIQRKKTFIQILNYLSKNNSDSIKKHMIYELNKDRGYYSNNFELGNTMLLESNNKIELDSILFMDSTMIYNTTLWRYVYYMNFYNNHNYIGKIDMSFISRNNGNILGFSVEPKIVIQKFDTTGILHD